MSQALHGGRLLQAAREFGLSEHSMVDFSANINVLAPAVSSADWARWREEIVRYPEPDAESLRQRLASVYSCNASQIIPTAGAIEGLYLAARLFKDCKVAIVEPAFSDYARAFEAAGCTPERVTLAPGMWHQPAKEWAELLEPFDVIVLGNPNNPTGSLHSKRQLCELLGRSWERPKSWIVDEAFIEFVAGDETLLPILDKHPSLILLRSLTKSWAIPGLRLGFIATTNIGWIDQLLAMQPPWSINSVASAWASEFLTPQRHEQLSAGLGELGEEGIRFATGLAQIAGLRVYPSACNFLLVEITDPSVDAVSIYRELGSRGLLVRVCDSFHGIPKGRFIRLAVRRNDDNQRLVQELSAICARLVGEAA